ncbi:MAG: valine--tRNA ligase [Planctomycetota bacterium]|nr:valine--tRNA ligase [Planctomycetota bacterium]
MSNDPSNTTPNTASSELPSRYRPADYEDRIRARWDAEKAFAADPQRVLRGEAKPYSILIPPPNVTAQLHLGHALNNTLQDILARAKRMQGFETLWMPGTDHAGIATQAVVEKRVMKEEKKRRNQFSREEFVAKIQAFKDEYEAIITDQLKRMGCSCDWDRQRFTMDPVCAKAVREAFFVLFRDGLIYRGKRLVNWDPALQTAVADDECYDEEIDAAFYYLRYPLVHNATEKGEDPQPVTWDELARRGYPGATDHPADEPAWVTVATTRPETYLGDTAVAINPHDPRAKALRGLFVELPLVGRFIPIIEDSYVVLPKALARTEEEANDPKAAFATGFLKVTPAHDTNDYELGQRHKLGMVNMMSPDGRVSDKHGWTDIGDAHIFVGKTMAEARKLVVKEFEARGWFEKQVPYRHSVKHSDRSKAVIEPYLSDQWYVKVTDPRMAASANAAMVKGQRTSAPQSGDRTPAAHDGAMTFHPERYAKTYEQWHDNIRDWCISRQLWWGHRIPVWSRSDKDFEIENLPSINNFRQALVDLYPQSGSNWQTSGRIAVLWDRFSGTHPSLGIAQKPKDTWRVYVCVSNPDDAEIISALKQWGFEQDDDVLDTWFSSALWPISTMGWPDAKSAGSEFAGLLQAFNPTSTLCTAREIITLWVSRMVMFNRYFLPETGVVAANAESRMPNASGSGRGPIPFRDVFIHPVIQDGEGRKMSKSLGNGVDPLDIIATHGADAMRFTLCQMCTETQDIRMPVQKDSASGKNTSPKFDLGRNYCNKLWNAARFALGILNAPGATPPAAAVQPGATLSLPDRWMLSRLAAGVAEANRSLERFEFSAYAQTLYDLLWRDFCDWYLEAIKPTVASDAAQRTVLIHALETIVRLLHPIAPFVTEAIYEQVSRVPRASLAGVTLGASRKGGLLCTAGWPIVAETLRDENAERDFERMRSLVTAIREVRAQQQVKPSRRITLHLAQGANVSAFSTLLTTLGGLETISDAPPASGAASTPLTLDGLEYRLSNLSDAGEGVNADAEKARIQKQIADLEKSVTTLQGRLANPGYTDRAPPAMVQQTRDQLTKAEADLAAARAALAKL